MERLKEKYKNEITKKLQKEFNLTNLIQVPKVEKLSINVGIGSFRDNKTAVDAFEQELTAITGQKPYTRTARKSEAGFKIRRGDVVAYAVTLRGDRMWAFLDKLVNVALPRVRDFQGLNPNSFDKNGNYSIGIKEHVIFPEINPNTVYGIRSMQVNVVTNTKNVDMNRYLLKELGFPFKGMMHNG